MDHSELLQEVLSKLRGLLEQALEVEADMGEIPTAQEALKAAIDEVEAMIRRESGSGSRRDG